MTELQLDAALNELCVPVRLQVLFEIDDDGNVSVTEETVDLKAFISQYGDRMYNDDTFSVRDFIETIELTQS